jgi:hypothetical protein
MKRVHRISAARWELLKKALAAKGWRVRTWTPERRTIYRARKESAR